MSAGSQAEPRAKAVLSVALISTLSHSKGWARYSLTDPSCDAPVQTSRTGNRWMSADARPIEVPIGVPVLLTIQVMERTGGRDQPIMTERVPLMTMAGETVEVEYRPGAQAVRLRISGACRVIVHQAAKAEGRA